MHPVGDRPVVEQRGEHLPNSDQDGVDAANVAEYLAIPSVVACGGSWLVRPDVVREGRFDEIERLAREVSTL